TAADLGEGHQARPRRARGRDAGPQGARPALRARQALIPPTTGRQRSPAARPPAPGGDQGPDGRLVSPRSRLGCGSGYEATGALPGTVRTVTGACACAWEGPPPYPHAPTHRAVSSAEPPGPRPLPSLPSPSVPVGTSGPSAAPDHEVAHGKESSPPVCEAG